MTSLGEQLHQCSLANPAPPAPDGLGGYTQAWIPLAPAKAYYAIAPALAQNLERSVAATVEASAAWLLTGAVHAGVNEYTRIAVLEGVYAGKSFDVRSVQRVLGDRGELPYRHALGCSEVVT
jgi:hypothetical protein